MGSVKRMAVLVGAAIALLGVAFLTNTVVGGGIECGSAVNPTNENVSYATYSRACDGPIRRQRWIGGGMLLLGTVAVVLGGPRSLVTPV
jgi:hypothetical protein